MFVAWPDVPLCAGQSRISRLWNKKENVLWSHKGNIQRCWHLCSVEICLVELKTVLVSHMPFWSVASFVTNHGRTKVWPLSLTYWTPELGLKCLILEERVSQPLPYWLETGDRNIATAKNNRKNSCSLDCLYCLIANSESVLIRQELRNSMKASSLSQLCFLVCENFEFKLNIFDFFFFFYSNVMRSPFFRLYIHVLESQMSCLSQSWDLLIMDICWNLTSA